MSPEDEDNDDALESAVADAFVRKGELVPTTVAEVRAAEDRGVDFEGDLPATLRDLSFDEAPQIANRDEHEHRAAASQRIVSIDDLRRAREEKQAGATRTASPWSHAGAFAAGLALAAGVALFLRAPAGSSTAHPEPGGAPVPSASGSAEPVIDRVSIPAVRACAADCCAGSSCAAAKGELRACASGRACLACGEPPAPNASAYRVHIANLVPTKVLDGTSLASLDICGRVAGADWSCVPAYAEPSALPASRTLAKLASAADLATGLEVELRPHGQKDVLGSWRDSVRLGPTVLCRGVGALVANDKGDHVGSLALTLDDPYYVELARAADVDSLKRRRASFDFVDVTPSLVQTSGDPAHTFALVVGPLDLSTSDKLRWALLEKSQEVRTVLGEDFVGAPMPVP